VRRSRWLILLGSAALCCALLGYGVIEAQVVQNIDLAEEQHPDNVGRFAPLEWTPADGEHPGKAPFEATCQLCHTLNDVSLTGPGLRGLEERVPSRERLFHFIVDPKSTDDDDPDDPITQHFLELRREWNDAMQPRGGNPNLTDEEVLNIIDYILRHDWLDFDEAAYLSSVRSGRRLVSGKLGFRNGGPSCITCHTVGPDADLRGARIAGNAAHTYVAAAALGGDRDSHYAEGLYKLLSGPDAPAGHQYYSEARGGTLTDGELNVVMVFFEHMMRQTGTERESNYLPILALILAAFGILLVEPRLYTGMFVKDEHEEEDGPYAEDDHH
jgi:cytochrome c5